MTNLFCKKTKELASTLMIFCPNQSIAGIVHLAISKKVLQTPFSNLQ